MSESAFVSMPFGSNVNALDNEWTKLYDFGIKPLEKTIDSVKDYHPVVLLRADRTLQSLGLKSNVKRLIEQSTFVLGVLTASVQRTAEGEFRVSNPNVLWELGYAEALGKPIVVLADDESVRALPVLAGVPNVCLYNHKLVQTAKPDEATDALKGIARDLAPFVTQACVDARSGQPTGIRTRARTYVSRDDVDLPTIIANAEQKVDILTTNVSYFVTGRFEVRDPLAHPFGRALKNGATVHILAMDPESVIAEYRARQLGRGDDVPGYRKELRDGIVRLYDMLGSEAHFYLKMYNDLPLQITIRVDNTILTSVVTRGERARKRIQIQFNVNDLGVTESFLSHFQSIFEESKDVKGVAWVIRHVLTPEDDRPKPLVAHVQPSSNATAKKNAVRKKRKKKGSQ